jgi:glycerol dehydrogenase-like iron-containing ADH family enzyme
LSSLAAFTTEVARRVRRQVVWTGEVAGRTIVDLDLLATAPPALNRAGAAEVVATLPATWDWHLADARDKGLPFSAPVADVGARCRLLLSAAADAVAAADREGLELLAGLLASLGAAGARAGHRRLVDGSEHTFVQAYEHRLGRPPSYGGLLGVGSVAMATLQYWYGVSAGGPIEPAEAIDLLTRCRVAANPHQLGLDEGTFRGLLRHAVRFHVGEFLPWGVLDEADVNWSASEEMWRMCWRVPVIRE